MKPGLTIGTVGQTHLTVAAEHLIELGSESVSPVTVFCTPAMIDLMEHAARAALAPYLEPDEESVGALVNVEHLAATPPGASVRAVARVTSVNRRLVNFDLEAYDGVELIGRGTHTRALITLSRFSERLSSKSRQIPEGMLLPMPLSPNPGPLPGLTTLQVQCDGAIVNVTLNRPEKRNAVNVQMTADWESLNQWLAGHPERRVVIVTGAGEAFCAGDDVPEVGMLDIDTAAQLSRRQAEMYLTWERLPQIFIAAVNGTAFGAGCVMACACDFRIAAHSARFGMPEILLGWPPGYGIAQLTALVGKSLALHMCVTGEPVTAQAALTAGLATDVVPQNRVLTAARDWAARLLLLPAQALRETKRLVHADEGAQPKLAHRADTAAYIRCLQEPDAQEGIAAFREKRAPRFGLSERSSTAVPNPGSPALPNP